MASAVVAGTVAVAVIVKDAAQRRTVSDKKTGDSYTLSPAASMGESNDERAHLHRLSLLGRG